MTRHQQLRLLRDVQGKLARLRRQQQEQEQQEQQEEEQEQPPRKLKQQRQKQAPQQGGHSTHEQLSSRERRRRRMHALAAESIFFNDPHSYIKGIAPELSNRLVLGTLRRSTSCGLNFLRHITGRAPRPAGMNVLKRAHAGRGVDGPGAAAGGGGEAAV